MIKGEPVKPKEHDPRLESDPFMSITQIAEHLCIDRKTVRKWKETRGLPIVQCSEQKKGCFLSQLLAWKSTLVPPKEA